MASRREDHGDFGVSGVHEITAQMISDWMSEDGYPDVNPDNAKMIIYQGRPALVWRKKDDGNFSWFAWYAWDDGKIHSKRRFCPFAENVPDDISEPIMKPEMDLDEIHRAQELIKE